MGLFKSLSVVAVDQIPEDSHEPPLNDLSALYNTCLLLEELCEKETGIGLSAMQTGIPWQLYVVRYELLDKKPKFRRFVGCKYIGIGDKIESIEGCLSLKRDDGSMRYFKVERFKKIKVFGKELTDEINLSIKDVDFEITDLEAIVHQHEIDHDLGLKGLISSTGVEFDIWK